MRSLRFGARLSLGAIFFMSGRTKVEGIPHGDRRGLRLFRDEYKVPLVPRSWPRTWRAYAEHLLPVLLVLGLFTRLSALASWA
jgi:putative oxidoreductase